MHTLATLLAASALLAGTAQAKCSHGLQAAGLEETKRMLAAVEREQAKGMSKRQSGPGSLAAQRQMLGEWKTRFHLSHSSTLRKHTSKHGTVHHTLPCRRARGSCMFCRNGLGRCTSSPLPPSSPSFPRSLPKKPRRAKGEAPKKNSQTVNTRPKLITCIVCPPPIHRCVRANATDPTQECTAYYYADMANVLPQYPPIWQIAQIVPGDADAQNAFNAIINDPAFPNLPPKGTPTGDFTSVQYDPSDPDCWWVVDRGIPTQDFHRH